MNTKPTIKIYSIHFNRPDFIRIQYDSFCKFIKNEFEFLVLNNSCDENIRNTCENLGISCIDLNNTGIHPSESHSLALIELKKYITNDGNFHVILDHDMFIVDDIDFFEYMENYSLMFIDQKRGHLTYMWPGLVIINSSVCPRLETLNFSLGIFDGVRCDSGGESYKYLLENPTLKIKIPTEDREFTDAEDLNTFFFKYDNKFLHYFRGSNWIDMDENIIIEKNTRLNKKIYE